MAYLGKEIIELVGSTPRKRKLIIWIAKRLGFSVFTSMEELPSLIDWAKKFPTDGMKGIRETLEKPNPLLAGAEWVPVDKK